MGNNKEKIFEILADGGSINGYRNFIGFEKDKTPNYLFNWSTNEIGLDDNGGFSTKSKLSMDFSKFWKKLIKKYPLIYDLHPTFIHQEYRVGIAKELRNKIKNGEEIYNIDSWAEILEISKIEIIDKDYFDYDLILEHLTKFKYKIEITNFNWNEIQFVHNDFKSISDFRTVFNKENILKNKIAGIYAYFNNDECLYIGKSKDLKKRIEHHWKTSQGLNNESRGQKHKILFRKHGNDKLTVFYIKVDDKFNSRIGEEIRKILENILHLKYKPKFEQIKNVAQQGV